MKARAILRRGAITLGAMAAATGAIGLSAGTAQAQPSAHAHHSAFIMPQPSDPSSGPSFSARAHHSALIMPQPSDGGGGPSSGARAHQSAFIMPQPSDPEAGPS